MRPPSPTMLHQVGSDSVTLTLQKPQLLTLYKAVQHEHQRALGRARDDRLSDACRKAEQDTAAQLLEVSRRLRDMCRFLGLDT